VSEPDMVTVTVVAREPTVQEVFDTAQDDIRVVVEAALQSYLGGAIATQGGVLRGARDRLMAGPEAGGIPFDVDGSFALDNGRLSTSGTFLGAVPFEDGSGQRVVSGDFLVLHDADAATRTALFALDLAWERRVDARTLVGWHIGGEVGTTTIGGDYPGEQDRIAADMGAYAVTRLGEGLFAEGFVLVGVGRNDLALADEVISLESRYDTWTTAMGGALSGLFTGPGFEVRPSLAASWGEIRTADIRFAGTIEGQPDEDVVLEGGSLRMQRVSLQPEVRFGLDGRAPAESRVAVTLAPRLGCERLSGTTVVDACGGGMDVAIGGELGQTQGAWSIRLGADRIGSRTTGTVSADVAFRF